MRKRIFNLLAELVYKHHVWILGLGVAATILSVYSLTELRLQTKILDLVPKDDPAVIEYNKIVKKFDSASQIIVGISGQSRNKMIGYAEQLKKRGFEAVYTDKKSGKKKPYIKNIYITVDKDFISKHALMLSDKNNLESFEEIYQNLEFAPLISAFNDFLEGEYLEDGGGKTEREAEDSAIKNLKGIMAFIEGIERVNDKGIEEYLDEVTDRLTIGDPYLFSANDQILLVTMSPSIPLNNHNGIMEGVKNLGAIIKDIGKNYPGIDVSMTGMPVMMMEETDILFEDMGLSTVFSFILIFAIFVIAFRMWASPLLAMCSLIMGIFWTAGFVTIAIGRLNLFTVTFAVMLIGLGIDFAIHLNTAYYRTLEERLDVFGALKEMYDAAGPGVFTGAITTAITFAVLYFTGIDALVELGVVLGAGILLTLLSSLTILPCLFVIHSKFLKSDSIRIRKERKLSIFRHTGCFIQKNPWKVFGVFVIVTALIVSELKNAEFEKDMLEVEPPDMPSVVLHRKILEEFEMNPDSAMVTTNSVEEARRISRRLKRNRMIGRVDTIADYLPSKREQEDNARVISRIGKRMEEIVESTAKNPLPTEVSQKDVKDLIEEIKRFQTNVQEIGQLSFTSMKQRLYLLCKEMIGDKNSNSRILELRNRLAKREGLEKEIAEYQKKYVPKLTRKIQKMAVTEPVEIATLPPEIKDRYLAKDGTNLITIYSSVDLWHGDKIDTFLSATRNVTDRVTGTAVLAKALIDLILDEGRWILLLALGTVLLILIIDFRRLSYAFLAIVPLIVGFLLMAGFFVVIGKKFDVGNVEALPIILGIGIDDTVHMLHAIRRDGRKSICDVVEKTGKAVFLTSVTTGVAFGTIAMATHRGLAGMGLLLVLGVIGCYLSSVILLPAIAKIVICRRDNPQKVHKESDLVENYKDGFPRKKYERSFKKKFNKI